MYVLYINVCIYFLASRNIEWKQQNLSSGETSFYLMMFAEFLQSFNPL